ncbi:DUF3772 domain-containing protein [Sulfitobacter sp. MF3-043]|uniref:DUF3772 domain-containing protein n=1 Tax=Sulfitobacter sediminivivens TaxID=3252902 RepID=UPI0036DA4314
MKNLLIQSVLAIGFVVTLVTATFAQNDLSEDLERYNVLALRAEESILNDSLSDETFEAIRERIAEYRAEFDAARNANAGRIATLREQIAALGTPPEGENAVPEDPSIAAKREDLTAQLNALLAPVQKAEASFLEADGLVRQIDQLLRDRQTNKLLTISPTPLNPVHWPQAWADLRRATVEIWAQNDQKDGAERWDKLRENGLIVVLSMVIGLVLIVRGRSWATKIVGRLERFGARGFGIWRFLVSLLRILIPLIGLSSVALSIGVTGILGQRGNEVLMLVPIIGGLMLGFRWVAERVFSKADDEALLLLSQLARKKARSYVSVITVAIIIDVVLTQILEGSDPAPSTVPVIAFITYLIICFALYQLGVILKGYTEPSEPEQIGAEARVSTHTKVVRSIGIGAIVVSCLTPILIGFGYLGVAEAMLQPYVMSIVIFGLLMTLQRFLTDVYGAITGQGIQARDALMSVVFGMVLLLLALPVLALLWGARPTDLSELWTAVGRGFAVGESRISPTDFLKFAIIFVVGYVLTRLIQSMLRSNVLPKTKIDIGGQNAIVSGLGYVGIFLAALAAITGAGIDLSSLAIVAGALSVGIGFGLQNIVSNFVSGIILLIERPISQGDWIEVGGQMGYVRDISVRSTRIETFDRTDVIVPNADLVSGTVTNYTRGNTVGRVIVSVGVAYGTDTRRVDRILREIAEAQPMVLSTPPPNIVFMNFGADALEFEVRMMLRDVNWMMIVKNDVNHAIAERFAAEKIEIPFAQRDLWIRNPEALTGAGPLKATKTPKGKTAT